MIVNKLKEYREAKGLSQHQVAKAVYVTPQTYWGYEKQQRTPPLETCFNLAKLYNCTIEDLFEKR